MNCKNTVFDFKRLVGRKFKEPEAQAELQRLITKSRELPDGSIGLEVRLIHFYFVIHCVTDSLGDAQG